MPISAQFLARLGQDAKLIEGERPFASISAAVSRRVKGNTETQWVRLSIFGARASSMAKYLTKGKQFFFTAQDLHTEDYTDKDGNLKTILVGTLVDIEFVDGDKQGQAPERKPLPTGQRYGRDLPPHLRDVRKESMHDDGIDDIPF